MGELIQILKIIKGFESVNFVNSLRYKDALGEHDLVYMKEKFQFTPQHQFLTVFRLSETSYRHSSYKHRPSTATKPGLMNTTKT